MRPEFKNKAKSIERAESLLEELTDSQVDLILLPEMALIGYRFDDRADIQPYVERVPDNIDALIDAVDGEEESKEGLPCSFKWAFGVSKRFNSAWVAVGFAEKDESDHFFNSALLVNHGLRECHVVRKVLSYEDDKKWADTEVTVSGVEYNFQHRDLMFPRLQRTIRCGIGICMDINFRDFEMSLYQTKALADH